MKLQLRQHPKIILLLASLMLLVGQFCPTVLLAETACRVDVGFKWKGTQAEELIAEHLITLEARGKDDKLAKQALTPQIDREKQRAQQACHDRHENMADCVAGKLTALSATLQGMSFSSRKTLEEAVSADCTARQGKCSEVTVSEIQCAEVVGKAEGGQSSASEEGGGKKEEKGKKKK